MKLAKSTGRGTIASGVTNVIPKYTAANTLDDSSISDNGTTVTTVEAVNQGAAAAFVLNSSGLPTKSNAITLAGQGFPLIVSAPTALTGQTGAVTNHVNFTPAASASTYRIQAVVNVTAWTTPASFTVVVTYTDDSGGAQTETLAVWRGSTGVMVAAVTTVNRYYSVPFLFRIDASATAITLSTTGTFTGSPVYNLAAVLERLV